MCYDANNKWRVEVAGIVGGRVSMGKTKELVIQYAFILALCKISPIPYKDYNNGILIPILSYFPK